MILKNWCIVDRYGDQCLAGDVYGHYRKEDGSRVTTSAIIGKTDDGHVVTNSGSVYDLVDVLAEYEETFPDAKQRLLNTSPVISQTEIDDLVEKRKIKVAERYGEN